jgi:hypothetical protein
MSSLEPIYVLAAPFAGLLLVFVWLQLRHEWTEYLRFAFAAFALYTLAFILLYAKRASISFEERNFRAIGLLLMVGIVHSFSQHVARPARTVFYAVLGFAAIYGGASALAHARQNLQLPMGEQGFRHGIATPPVLEFMRERFGEGTLRSNAVVYIPSPEMGLEARSARLITVHADFESIDKLSRDEYRGRAQSVYVFLQKRLVQNGKATVILRSFRDYDANAWEEADLGDFVCFVQAGSGRDLPRSRSAARGLKTNLKS